MKEHGSKIRCQDMEYINMPMEPPTRVNGRTINSMEKGSTNSPTEQYMKAIGKIT